MIHTHTIPQLCTDNTTASGIENGTIKKQQSRAINIHYFGICDQQILKKNSLHENQDSKILQDILQNIIM